MGRIDGAEEVLWKDVKRAQTLWKQGEKENPSLRRMTPERRAFIFELVEAGGIEPPSESISLKLLHAYPKF